MIGAQSEETSLRAYLLGRLPSDEQTQVEERLLLDGEYVELLQVLEDELTDSYLSDNLSKQEREQFESYFLSTPARRRKLRMARVLRRYVNESEPSNTAFRESPSPVRTFRTRPVLSLAWRGAIAAMLMCGIALGIWRIAFYQSLSEKGHKALQAALKDSPIEGRIAGFDWGPRRVTLGDNAPSVADSTKLDSAGSYFFEAVNEKQDGESHHALGQFYLARREIDKAIEQLGLAAQREPGNARVQSDLGAALLERGKAAQAGGVDGSLSDFAESLEHLDKAVQLDSRLLEPMFNRALCHEYMRLRTQAEEDWQAYLKFDSASPWAAEARRHLTDLQDQKQRSSIAEEDDTQRFLTAFRTHERDTAWKLVSGNREVIRGRLIWWRLLDDFFKLTDAGQIADARVRLQALRYAGELDKNSAPEAGAARQGDPYVSELAEFYQGSSRQLPSLAEAHNRVNEGNGLYLNTRPNDALRSYRSARAIFEHAEDEWEVLLTDFLIGSCHIQTGEIEKAEPLFERTKRACDDKGYRWLLLQSLFSLAMVQDRKADHSEALENTEQALQIAEQMEDSYDTQRSLAQIADQYRKLGNYDLALANLDRSLKETGRGWPGGRQMWRTCDQLAQVFVARRLNDSAAAAYSGEALWLALETRDNSLIYVSYVNLGLIRSRRQDYAEAIKLAQLGLEAAPAPVHRAYAKLQLGFLHRRAGDVAQALSDYDDCIQYVNEASDKAGADAGSNPAHKQTDPLPALLYGGHKGKLFCLFDEGNESAAQEELGRTLQLLEEYRDNIREETNRNTFFNVEQSVYDAAIDFEHTNKNDEQAVFDYSEASRARSLLSLITTSEPRRLEAVQRDLPKETQLVEYIALEDKLLICLVSKSNFSVTAVPIHLNDLTYKVMDFRRAILAAKGEADAQARELYDLLIKPVALKSENGGSVCIVPDKVLNNLPFAALKSESGRYLIEDFTLTHAPSAAVYLTCSERGDHAAPRNRERLLAVGAAAFDRAAFPSLPLLPSTEQQVRKISGCYSEGSPLVLTRDEARKDRVKREMERSDVIHLASHYVVYGKDPMNSRLLLAGQGSTEDSSAGFLRADEVYALKLRRAPLVVLSACQSGVEQYYGGEGMIGMSRVFIAAGAPVVVASLWAIDAYATDDLMIDFHRRRRALDGLTTAEALRQAQLNMLRNATREDYKQPYYWAGFAAIGGRTNF